MLSRLLVNVSQWIIDHKNLVSILLFASSFTFEGRHVGARALDKFSCA